MPLETRVGGTEDAKKAMTRPESVECQAVKPASLPEFVGEGGGRLGAMHLPKWHNCGYACMCVVFPKRRGSIFLSEL